MSDKNLRDALNLPEAKISKKEIEVIEKAIVDEKEYVKDNIRSLVDSGKSSLEVLMQFAKNSENPRAFEVVATLIKTLLEANKEYHAITKPKEETKDNKEKSSNDTIQTITFNPSSLGKYDAE